MAATYNVPALVQVKAPQINVSKDAYTNPQPLYNKAYDQYAKIAQQIATSASGFNINRSKYIKEEKEAQNQLMKDRLTNYSKDILAVGNLGNTGNSKFDKNKMNFFLDLKQKFAEIQNAMAENPEFAAQGSRELAQINGIVKQFSAAAPKMLSEIVWMREKLRLKPGTQGAISSLFPDAMSRMLLAIGGDGDMDVSIVLDDGQLVLFAPEQTYRHENKDIHMGPTAINVSKFLQLNDKAGGAIPTIGNWEDEVKEATEASLGVVGTGDNAQDNVILPKYIDTEVKTTKEGAEYTVKTWAKEIVDEDGKPVFGNPTLTTGLNMEIPNPFAGQRLTGRMLAIQELITNGTFNSLLNNQDPNDIDMEIYWADVIGDPTDEFGDKLSGYDGIPGQNSKWDVTDPKKVALAVEWFANQGIKKYENSLGMQGTPKMPTKDITLTATAIKNNKAANTIFTDVNKLVNGDIPTVKFFNNKEIHGKEILLKDDGGNEITHLRNGILTIAYDTGKGTGGEVIAGERDYDLNNLWEYKTFIKDFVKSQYNKDRAADISAAITAAIDKSIADNEETKEKWEGNIEKENPKEKRKKRVISGAGV